MSVIARQCHGAYFAPMPRLLLRIFALVAVLSMPAVMTGTPAAAQPAATAESRHCSNEDKPAEDSARQQIHCMACSALPALDEPAPVAALVLKVPRRIARTRPISGIVLEIATPPPKLS